MTIDKAFLENEIRQMERAVRQAEDHVMFARGSLSTLIQLRDMPEEVEKEDEVESASR